MAFSFWPWFTLAAYAASSSDRSVYRPRWPASVIATGLHRLSWM